MKKSVLASMVLFGVSVAPAWAFDGVVVDARTGSPIANAEVSILGRTGVVYTDDQGRFTWRPDPAPPFEILVVHSGGRLARPILVEALPSEVPLEVRLSPVLDEKVSVTAGAAPDIETTPGNATTLVPGRDIQARQPENLIQSLENVAGVSSVSEGHAAVPAIRGLANGRTLILLDGARVTSDRRVGPSATYLDPFVLDAVEVARGPGSVAYGSDAFGGVIYARTRRIATSTPVAARVTGSIGAGIPQQRVGAEVSKGFEKGGVVVQGHYRDFEDYDSPQGEVFNSGATDRGFLARGEYALGRGVFGATWQSDFGKNIDRPRNNSQTVRFYYPTEDSHRLTAGYDLKGVRGFERVSVTGFLGSYHQITDQDRFPTATTGRTIERADYSADDFQVRATAERLLRQARVEFGVDVNGRYDVGALDISETYALDGTLTRVVENVSIDNAHRTDTGAFATLEVALATKLLAAGGLRGDYVTSENTGGFFGDRSTSKGAASGSASLSAGPWLGWTVTGQVASGFRDPTVSDRYYRGPTGRGFITGNPDLEPERSLQYDIGMRYTGAGWRGGVFYFHYRIDDLIERYQTTTDFFFFRNRGRARLRGIEVEAQGRIFAGITLDVAAQITRGKALDDGTPLDGVPPSSLILVARRGVGSRGFAELRGAFFATDDDPGPTELRTPGYTLIDALGGVSVARWLDLNVTLRNLLDRTYPMTPDARAMPSPGTSVVFTATARF